MTAFSVALGGAIGALLRWLVMGWAGRSLGHGFPWGTACVNVAGSLVMGLAAAALLERLPGGFGRFGPFVLSGVLGGFTTFSAFSLDALYLMERGRAGAAAVYVGGSVALSIAALAAGLALGRAMWGAGT